MEVTVQRREPGAAPCLFGFEVERNGRVGDLRRVVAAHLGVPEAALWMHEVHGAHFFRDFPDRRALSEIRPTDKIFACVQNEQ